MKKLIIISLVLILSIFIGIRIWQVNKDIDLPTVHSFQMGEEVAIEQNIFLDSFENMDGYTVTVNDAEIISYDQFLIKYNYQEDKNNPLFESNDLNFPEMIYDLHLTIKNTNTSEKPNEHKGINFVNYQLIGTNFLLQISNPMYMIANPDLNGELFEGFQLRPASEMDFQLPFYFGPSSIIDKIQVQDILDDDVYLVISLFPEQKQILIK